MREAIAEQHVHHRASECAIGAGADEQLDVRLLHRGVVIDVDSNDRRATVLPRLHGVGHDVDLGDHGIGAPQHHAVRIGDLARIGARHPAMAREPSRPGQRRADRGILARIAFGVTQPVDAVAHHQAHRPGVEIGPDGFGSEPPLGFQEALSRPVERLVPRDLGKLTRSLRSGPNKRILEPVRIVHTFRVAGDLGADHARRVTVVGRAAHASHSAPVEDLNFQRAGRGAVMGAGGGAEQRTKRRVHEPNLHACRRWTTA